MEKGKRGQVRVQSTKTFLFFFFLRQKLCDHQGLDISMGMLEMIN